jgi:DNA transformation protein and related proteins
MAQAPSDFANYCCELLASAGHCVPKRMFGGFGISTDGLTLAIIADLGDGEKLWLKGDADTRSRYEAAGCPRFEYQAKGKTVGVNYFAAPEDAMDSPDAMRPWAALALDCAVRARAAKPPAKPRAKAVAKPAVKTAVKSVAKPAAKTVAKPAAKPAVKTPSKPVRAVKPATASQAKAAAPVKAKAPLQGSAAKKVALKTAPKTAKKAATKAVKTVSKAVLKKK